MIPPTLLSGHVQLHLILFSTFCLAALQNVTVDDAAVSGSVVPQYTPSSDWNIGNTCTTCLTQPDPAYVYDGTWHEAVYNVANGYTQEIQFTFTGSALYIFFIMANYVEYATTLTNITFWLDGVVDSTYTHNPTSSTSYEYNVPVYVNEAMAYGEHNMTIQPLNSTTNVLMLFDYLIYSVDTSESSPASAPSTIISTISSPSQTSSALTQESSSGQNLGTIVGSAVGGVIALVLATIFLICYRRRKSQNQGIPAAEEGTIVEPFILSRQARPAYFVGPTSSIQSAAPFTGFVSGNKSGSSSGTLSQTIPPSTAVSVMAVPDAPISNPTGLFQQVEMLRGEVARLRYMQDQDRNMLASQSEEAPPEYS